MAGHIDHLHLDTQQFEGVAAAQRLVGKAQSFRGRSQHASTRGGLQVLYATDMVSMVVCD